MKNALLLFSCLLGFVLQLASQEHVLPELTYKGLRLSLFHFEAVKQSPTAVLLRCDVANTGRYAVAFNKNKNQPPPAALLIELDTLNLPRLLLGWEERVSTALMHEKITLEPGEICQGLLLNVSLENNAPVGPGVALSQLGHNMTALSTCGDLSFDTAFVVRRDEKSLWLRFVLRNGGPTPILLADKRGRVANPVALNAYFVRGDKLTRGAILATGIFLPLDRELTNGYLLAGQQMSGEIEVNLRDRTRFAPNLVLEINPFQTVTECNPANNTLAVPLDF